MREIKLLNTTASRYREEHERGLRDDNNPFLVGSSHVFAIRSNRKGCFKHYPDPDHDLDIVKCSDISPIPEHLTYLHNTP